LTSNLANQINEEKVLFKTFLDSDPDFSGEPITAWRSLTETGFDPPDVICDTVNGKRIGVEICQWAHEGAMKSGRLADQVDNNILKAIGTQPTNKPEHFGLVVFYTKTRSHLPASEQMAFRKAFFDLIAYIDREWPTLKHRGRPYEFRDLKRFTPLHKHLAKIAFCPPNDALNAAVEKGIKTQGGNAAMSHAGEEPSDWIMPVGRCQSVRTPYDKDQWEPDDHGNITLEGSLLKSLRTKADRCCHSRLKTPCSELGLLIAFHQAIPYCAPVFNIEDTAKKAVALASRGASWPFHRTYLLIAIEDHPAVHRLL
jgi:hypothetical protein